MNKEKLIKNNNQNYIKNNTNLNFDKHYGKSLSRITIIKDENVYHFYAWDSVKTFGDFVYLNLYIPLNNDEFLSNINKNDLVSIILDSTTHKFIDKISDIFNVESLNLNIQRDNWTKIEIILSAVEKDQKNG